MEPGTMFLLAMQAAGSIMQIVSYKDQRKLTELGRELEHEGIEANIELARASASEDSLEGMKALRQNLGTQMAVQAARGTATNVGSALFLSQKSIGQFNQDEKVRRLNLLSREASLRASDVLSGLHTLQSETQMGQAVTQKLFESLPGTSAFNFGNTQKLTSQTNKTASSAASRAAGRASYGLNPVGA
jgi:hypothetical protein